MLDIIPLGQRIIIEQDKVPEKLGKIYIPNDSKELEPTEGKVVAVGDEVTLVDKGDHIFYGKYAGFKFKRNDIEYVFLNEEDILGIVRR